MATQFEWDPRKAKANLRKHHVDFDEASTILDDPMFMTFLDTEHSVDEERYITIGLSNRARLLMVAHAERNNRIRIIRECRMICLTSYSDFNWQIGTKS